MSKIIFSIFFLFTNSSFGHGDHDHGPKSIQAPKGGVVRSLETVNLELVNNGSEVKIYVYDTDLKATEVSKYPVSATVTLPKKKPETAKLSPQSDHWVLYFDAKNAHRYTLELSIKQGGHDDKVKWVIEPKK